MGDVFIRNSKSMIDILGKEWEYDCMGCAIAKHEIIPPGGFIYESDNFIISQDPEIPIKGFIIISTKVHINSFTQLNGSMKLELMDLLSDVIKNLKELGVTEEVTIVQEERSKHFHIWVFPHHEWMDNRFERGVSSLREISKYAKENITEKDIEEILEIVAKLREKFI